jgi:adenosine deaminase
MILEEAQWFTPTDASVADALENNFKDYNKYAELAKRQTHYAKTNFSFDKMAEALDAILDRVPRQVEIKLPKLKKLS